jgi:hypothetical protein
MATTRRKPKKKMQLMAVSTNFADHQIDINAHQLPPFIHGLLRHQM